MAPSKQQRLQQAGGSTAGLMSLDRVLVWSHARRVVCWLVGWVAATCSWQPSLFPCPTQNKHIHTRMHGCAPAAGVSTALEVWATARAGRRQRALPRMPARLHRAVAGGAAHLPACRHAHRRGRCCCCRRCSAHDPIQQPSPPAGGQGGVDMGRRKCGGVRGGEGSGASFAEACMQQVGGAAGMLLGTSLR